MLSTDGNGTIYVQFVLEKIDKEYLSQLQERQRWNRVKRNFTSADIVLIVDCSAQRNSWIMGRVIEAVPDKRGLVRGVRIETRTSCLNRPVTKICLLQEAEES